MSAEHQQIVKVDPKGRVNIGKRYANRILKESLLEDGSILLIPQVLVAENEAWFFNNDERVTAIRRSIRDSQEENTTVLKSDELTDL